MCMWRMPKTPLSLNKVCCLICLRPLSMAKTKVGLLLSKAFCSLHVVLSQLSNKSALTALESARVRYPSGVTVPLLPSSFFSPDLKVSHDCAFDVEDVVELDPTSESAPSCLPAEYLLSCFRSFAFSHSLAVVRSPLRQPRPTSLLIHNL